MRRNRWKRATRGEKRKRNTKKWRRHHEPAALGAPSAPAAVGDENAD